jgi:SNARE protein
MSRVVNELDSIHFSIKKASKLVKEIGRQVNFYRIQIILFSIVANLLYESFIDKLAGIFVIGCY